MNPVVSPVTEQRRELHQFLLGDPPVPPVASPWWPLPVSSPKASSFGLHRTVKAQVTFDRLQPFFKRIGITRVADITGLDRVQIPVFSAKVPRSRDVISVYHGKGISPADAKTGAVMEATERYIASRDRLPDEVASCNELRRRAPVVDPREINQALHPSYTEDTQLAWLQGLDLLSGEHVFVPHSAALFPVHGYAWQPAHKLATSNALASGNTLEEAVCHALTELIERDAHTIHEVCQRQLEVVRKRDSAEVNWLARLRDELTRRFPRIDLATLPERPSALVEKFRNAGIEPQLVSVDLGCGASTVICSHIEDSASASSATASSRVEYGVGADPNVEIAAVRALTEMAQGRAAYREAAREDLNDGRRTTPLPGGEVYSSRIPTGPAVAFGSLESRSSADIVVDIGMMLSALRAAGIERCVLIDLSLPEIPVHVARLIAPGMESWIVDHGKVGQRARIYWRQLADSAR